MDALNDRTSAAVEITLNGKSRALATGASVSDLIATLDLQDRLVVVERNGIIVPRTDFASTILVDGDTLEIVHFVGGG